MLENRGIDDHYTYMNLDESVVIPYQNLDNIDEAVALFMRHFNEKNKIGVLVDGTVVPCCLDSAGALALGNLFEQSLEDVLASPRAKAIYDGFTKHKAVEPLCRRCGYAALIK